ncbi:MAG: outer membrane beta-barrel protein [Gammaproteobacteria bacterium]
MKNIAFALVLASASIAAQAQQLAPVNQMPRQQVHGFVGFGLTAGGDKLATAYYERGYDVSLHAGGLVAFTAGIDYTVTPEFSFQGSVGYHVDQASASNGDMRFQRFPIEVLAYYKVAPQWRVGGGARWAASPKLRTSGAGDIGDYDFEPTVGAVVEAEYLVSPQVGVKFRYVAEKYKEKGSSYKIDGNHAGVYANLYF